MTFLSSLGLLFVWVVLGTCREGTPKLTSSVFFALSFGTFWLVCGLPSQLMSAVFQAPCTFLLAFTARLVRLKFCRTFWSLWTLPMFVPSSLFLMVSFGWRSGNPPSVMLLLPVMSVSGVPGSAYLLWMLVIDWSTFVTFRLMIWSNFFSLLMSLSIRWLPRFILVCQMFSVNGTRKA